MRPAEAARLLKAALSRDDAVERVTRIELAWPAWKVAVLVLGDGLRVVPVRSWLTLDDWHSPCVMAREWPSAEGGRTVIVSAEGRGGGPTKWAKCDESPPFKSSRSYRQVIRQRINSSAQEAKGGTAQHRRSQ